MFTVIVLRWLKNITISLTLLIFLFQHSHIIRNRNMDASDLRLQSNCDLALFVAQFSSMGMSESVITTIEL